MSVSAALKWYVIHTYSGFEEKAKAALIERARAEGLTSSVGDVFIPRTVKEKVTKTGKKKKTEKTSYPGYMLVQLDITDSVLHLVKGTPKVIGFVGDSRKPRPISDQEVLRLTTHTEEQAKKQAEIEVRFERGESVKVTDGPFTNFDGVVDEVRPEKAKVRVLVSIFGRETPVELDYNQVQKLG